MIQLWDKIRISDLFVHVLGLRIKPDLEQSTAGTLALLLLNPSDILPADRVPCCHVFLHALGEAGLLAAR